MAAAQPLYVVDVDAGANSITVGPGSALMARSVLTNDVRWVSGESPEGQIAVTCKVRYNMRDVPAVVRPLPDERCEVRFAEPERAPAPGQAAVFYCNDTVLGGGTIGSVRRMKE